MRLHRFLEDGGSLSVLASPRDPVAFSEIDVDDPRKLPDVLGLEITHSE